MPVRSRLRSLVLPVVLALVFALSPAEQAGAEGGLDLWVDVTSPACSDGADRGTASSAATPWCSVARAASAATAGDTVHVRPGTYSGVVRVTNSGRTDAPIRFLAEGPGAVLDAGGAPAAVKVVGLADVIFEGLTVTGATSQGIWVDGATRIWLNGLTVINNVGHGIQVLRSSAVTVNESNVRDNGMAGIFEGTGTTDSTYVGNEITGNGVVGSASNGDGIQLGGERGHVLRNTITGNGTPGPYEHGIYAGPGARSYLIEENFISTNAGSNIKAAGSDGVIRYNRIEDGRLGVVLSDNPSPVSVYYNLIIGKYQHAVFLTVGDIAAQVRLWNNTIVMTGRSASSGDASAVFVKAATSLDLRNNLVSYTNPDNLGIALYVADPSQLWALKSDNNWVSTREPQARHFFRNSRLTLSAWRKATAQDAKTVASAPPTIDPDARVLSKNLGIDRGQNVGLQRDYSGRALRSGNAPDIGAYESSG